MIIFKSSAKQIKKIIFCTFLLSWKFIFAQEQIIIDDNVAKALIGAARKQVGLEVTFHFPDQQLRKDQLAAEIGAEARVERARVVHEGYLRGLKDAERRSNGPGWFTKYVFDADADGTRRQVREAAEEARRLDYKAAELKMDLEDGLIRERYLRVHGPTINPEDGREHVKTVKLSGDYKKAEQQLRRFHYLGGKVVVRGAAGLALVAAGVVTATASGFSGKSYNENDMKLIDPLDIEDFADSNGVE